MNISLLTAVPHSISDLEKAVNIQSRDYVRNNLRGVRSSVDDIWSVIKPSLGVKAEELFNFCDRQNVKVYKNMTLPKLEEAARTSDVIFILAHWKAPYLSTFPSDFLTSLEHLEHGISICIDRSILSANINIQLKSAPSENKAKDILTWELNESIKNNWHGWVRLPDGQSGHKAGIFSPIYGHNTARAEIDQIFGADCLLPGARIDLHDGLKSASEIASCFSPNWRGVCDFICCTSAFLAEEVKCKCPKGLFRADSRFLNPSHVIPYAHQVIKELIELPQSKESLAEKYVSVAFKCDQQLGE
jgi:hypothetical protein